MFRFTIRDVLWLTVVVALAVGWWMDRWQLASDAQKSREQRIALETDRNYLIDLLRDGNATRRVRLPGSGAR